MQHSADGAREQGGHSRGEAELLGLILLIGFVVVGATSVFVIGNSALSQVQDSNQDEIATQSLTDAKTEFSSLQTGDVRDVSLSKSVERNTQVKPNNGRMTIITDSGKEHSTRLGSVVYENGDSHIAYQGGGVWELHNNTSTMVSSPPLQSDASGTGVSTLHIGATLIKGQKQSGSDLTVRSTGNSVPMENIPERSSSGTTAIKIKSEYYKAWGTLFEDRTETDVEYVHDKKTVIASLTASTDVTVENALTVDGQLDAGGGISVSSYNSDGETVHDGIGSGDYKETGEGDIIVSEGFDGRGSATVNGDLYVNGDYTIDGGAATDGSIYATGDVDIGSVTVTEEIVAGGDITTTNGGAVFAEESEVRVAGDFTDTNSAEYNGLIHAGGRFEASGGGTELSDTGEIRAERIEINDAGETHEGDEVEEPSMSELDTIDQKTQSMPDPSEEVRNAINQYQDAKRLENLGGKNADDEIRAGNYYVDGNLNYGGSPQLDFNTTDGDINLVVDGDIDAANLDAEIEGEGEVHIYVNGTFETTGGAAWTTDDGSGDKLWVYTAEPTEAVRVRPGVFYGVIVSESEVELGGGTNVYGALVTDSGKITGGQNIYYDEAIQKSSVGGVGEENNPDTIYLDISVDEVTVEK